MIECVSIPRISEVREMFKDAVHIRFFFVDVCTTFLFSRGIAVTLGTASPSEQVTASVAASGPCELIWVHLPE